MLLSPELNAVMVQWFSLSIFMMKALVVFYLLYGLFILWAALRD